MKVNGAMNITVIYEARHADPEKAAEIAERTAARACRSLIRGQIERQEETRPVQLEIERP